MTQRQAQSNKTGNVRQFVLSTLITLGALIIGVLAYYVLYGLIVECRLAEVSGQGLTNLCDADQAAMVSMLAIIVALAVTWLASYFGLLYHKKETEKEVAVLQQVAPPPPSTTKATTEREVKPSQPSAPLILVQAIGTCWARMIRPPRKDGRL